MGERLASLGPFFVSSKCEHHFHQMDAVVHQRKVNFLLCRGCFVSVVLVDLLNSPKIPSSHVRTDKIPPSVLRLVLSWVWHPSSDPAWLLTHMGHPEVFKTLLKSLSLNQDPKAKFSLLFFLYYLLLLWVFHKKTFVTFCIINITNYLRMYCIVCNVPTNTIILIYSLETNWEWWLCFFFLESLQT